MLAVIQMKELTLSLLLLSLSGCATDKVDIDNSRPTYSTKYSGYYWRNSYNHRYSNAPPVRDDIK